MMMMILRFLLDCSNLLNNLLKKVLNLLRVRNDVLTRHLTSVISDFERFYANGTLQFSADVYIRDLNHRHRFNRCFRRR
ncbi:hypothetical protein HanXRQr2_Chr06g0260801 [Helianthus annuus]|uniref:Uncharacterized protein n=1 Tax=Helianthus annuus TaxID=4232 RepID=A0A9K3NJH0_HELAN|nr:hypothetical protein HanXRQr2_Chr06g0260801 [Helianthus annuus]KAJ0915599.1 hypothetical protein HanPSC8_Chr06g0251651 [Helianthus annuus]